MIIGKKEWENYKDLDISCDGLLQLQFWFWMLPWNPWLKDIQISYHHFFWRSLDRFISSMFWQWSVNAWNSNWYSSAARIYLIPVFKLLQWKFPKFSSTLITHMASPSTEGFILMKIFPGSSSLSEPKRVFQGPFDPRAPTAYLF